ncbi:hypothetical protein [Streptomyces albogriseolus]|uniref:hypothetical protein n=1 Tax=Streptomyces albogriseolus TaxID=1887 RepID=UPI0037ADDB92
MDRSTLRAEIVREMTTLVIDAFEGQLRYSNAVGWWLDDGHPYATNDREMMRSGVNCAVIAARDRLESAAPYGSPRWSVLQTSRTYDAVLKAVRLASLRKERPADIVVDLYNLGWSTEDENSRYWAASRKLKP